MGCFTSQRRDLATSSLILAGLTLLVCSVSLTASAATSMTWTTQADFLTGTLSKLDAASSPGALVLESSISPWVRSYANPALGPSTGWESDWVDSPSVLYEAGVYKMWYQGCVGTQCSLGYATSSDGMSWTRFAGNPVLMANAAGWDQTLGNPVVVHDGNVYRMWYAGNGPLAIQIGYATSPDGTTWTRYGSAPVFRGLQSWDSAATSTPAVIKVGLEWVLYFSGHSGDFVYKVGRATSPDGINWNEDPLNPLMVPDVSWESSRVHPGGVVAGPAGFEMFYTGNGLDYDQIGRATSPDGRVWTKDPGNPVFTPGGSGAWDGAGVAVPKIVAAAGATRMYYGGAEGPWNWRIGFAVYSPGSAPPSYVSSGYFVSAIVDSSSRNTLWDSIEWAGTVSDSTGIGVSVQVGNTSYPDYSWSSPSAPVFVQGPTKLHLPPARFALVLAALVTLNASVTPVLDRITLAYSPPPPPPPSLWTVSVAGFPLIALLILVVPSAVVGAILVLFMRYARASPAVVAVSARCATCESMNQATNKFCFRCGRPMLVPLSPPPPPPPPT